MLPILKTGKDPAAVHQPQLGKKTHCSSDRFANAGELKSRQRNPHTQLAGYVTASAAVLEGNDTRAPSR